MESNYRKFYCNDPSFFLKVLGLEEGPYSMKVHVFPNRRYKGTTPEDDNQNRYEEEVRDVLIGLGAEDLKSSHVREGDKIRFLFTIQEQSKAVACFDRITKHPEMNGGVNTAKIFYVKPEPVFMKYADEEAKAYFDMEGEREAKQLKRQQENPR